MIKVYTLRHMFRGLPEGETAPILFTRDNEHKLSLLSEKDLNEAISRGWVKMTEVPTIGEDKKTLRESAKPAAVAEAQKESEKEQRKGRAAR